MARKNFERRENQEMEIAKQPVYTIRQLEKIDAEDVWNLIDSFKKFNDNTRTEQPSIKIQVENNDPIKVEFMSDMHFGATTTNYEAIRARVDYIVNTPGVYVVFGGDVIDGMNKEYQDTILASAIFANINKEIEAFKSAVYYPLLKAGKVLFAVTGFSGHEEWIRKASGLSPSSALYDDAIPYLENGGIASFYFENSAEPDFRFVYAHNDGGANKPSDTFKGQRAITGANPEIDGAYSGHNHGVAGVAEISNGQVIKEVTNKPKLSVKVEQTIDREKYKTIYGKGGQRKSDNADNKDPFPTKHPSGPVVQADAALEFYQANRGWNAKPVLNDFDQNQPNPEYHEKTFKKLQLWNEAEKTGTTQERIEEFHEKAGGMQMIQVKSRSKYNKYENDTTPYAQELYLKVIPKNKDQISPFFIAPFAAARASSKHMDKELVKSRVDEVANDPYAFAIFLREMFDKFMSTNENREVHFEKLMQLLAPILTTDKTLGWLQSGSMLNSAWKKPIGKKDKLLPAKEINERYGIPILENYSTVILAMPNGLEIAMLILDATSNNSKENIFYGPYLAMQKYGGRDIALGGKSGQSGYMTYPDSQDNNKLKTIAIPAWMSNKINIVNNDARENAPKNKMGIIINPLDNQITIALDEQEQEVYYKANILSNAVAQSKRK